MDERVMSAVASGVAARYGVKVTVSGEGAWSTVTPVQRRGRTEYVPEINIPASVRKPGPEAMTLMRGFLDHEAAHVRWSGWGAIASAAGDPMLKSMLNVVEDVRVERLMGAAFAGAGQNLRDIAVLLFGGDRWQEHVKHLAAYKADEHAAEMLALSWALYRFRSMDVPELKQGLDALSAVLDAVRPRTRVAMEKALASALKRDGWPASTDEALRLAAILVNAFRRTGCDAPAGTVDEPPHEAAASAAAQALKDAGMEENQSDFLSQCAANASGQQAKRRLTGERDLEELCGETPGLSSLGQAVSGMLDALDPCQGALRDARSHRSTAFLPKEIALAERVLADWEPLLAAQAAGLCAGLGARLRSLLQAETRVMKGTGRTGRRLDGSALWRAAAMDGRVFRSASRRRDVSASVLLLVDASGSMCGQEELLASAAVLSVLNALDAVKGVDAGACAFTEMDGRCVHAVIRMPGDRTPAAMLPRSGASGSTDVAGSMLACSCLLPADAPRRIMVVVSDGHDSARQIRMAEHELERRGVLVAGVGIGSDSLCAALEHSRFAEDAAGIPAAVFGALQEVLLGSPA
jgi:hypothetical protein